MPTVREVADLIGGSVSGDDAFQLENIATLETAGPRDLSFLTNPKYAREASSSPAPALLCHEDVSLEGKILIRHSDPYWALSRVIPLFRKEAPPRPGIHPGASVDPESRVDPSAFIGSGAVIGSGVVIGPRTVIHPGAAIMGPTTLGEDVIVYPNVTIYPRCRIGNRVILQAGTVIGSDGFGFAFHEGAYHKIPQVGGVVIEDDVEIGANSTVDAGTLTPTTIGQGTKIDNLVQIAHNVQIGRHSVFVAQVGISGSTRIGNYCVFAGQSGAVGHIKIGNRVTVTARTGVTRDVPDGKTVSGFPSRDHHQWLKELATLQRLPRTIKALKGETDGTSDREDS